MAPQRRHQDRHDVLNSLRLLGHPALTVGELELMLDQDAGHFLRQLAELIERELKMADQSRTHTRHGLPISTAELLAELPLRIGAQLFAEFPGVNRIERTETLDAVGLQCLADRLEELLAVLLDQGL